MPTHARKGHHPGHKERVCFVAHAKEGRHKANHRHHHEARKAVYKAMRHMERHHHKYNSAKGHERHAASHFLGMSSPAKVLRLVGTMVAPTEFEPERMPDTSMDKSAVASIHNRGPQVWNLPTQPSARIDLQATVSAAILMRHPVLANIKYCVAPDQAGRYYQYQASYDVPAGQTQNNQQILCPPDMQTCITNAAFFFALGTAWVGSGTSTAAGSNINALTQPAAKNWAPHGPYLGAKYLRNGASQAVWIDAPSDDLVSGFQITVYPSGNATATQVEKVTITLFKYNGGTMEFIAEQTIVSASGAEIAPTSAGVPFAFFNGGVAGSALAGTGDYCIMVKYTPPPTAASSKTAVKPLPVSLIVASQSNSCFAHAPLTEWTPAEMASGKVTSTLISGAVMTERNGADFTSNGGFQVAVQMKGDTYWWLSGIQGNVAGQVSGNTDTFSFLENLGDDAPQPWPIAEGACIPLKPTQPEDIEYMNDVKLGDTNGLAPFAKLWQSPLDATSDYIIWIADTGSPDSGNNQVSFDYSVQYKTMAQKPVQGSPICTPEEAEAAREIVNSMEQYRYAPKTVTGLLGELFSSVGSERMLVEAHARYIPYFNKAAGALLKEASLEEEGSEVSGQKADIYHDQTLAKSRADDAAEEYRQTKKMR